MKDSIWHKWQLVSVLLFVVHLICCAGKLCSSQGYNGGAYRLVSSSAFFQ